MSWLRYLYLMTAFLLACSSPPESPPPPTARCTPDSGPLCACVHAGPFCAAPYTPGYSSDHECTIACQVDSDCAVCGGGRGMCVGGSCQ
jgi:hypothetical protein